MKNRLMIKKRMKDKGLFLPFYLFTFLLLAACARMGSPDGGWFDDDPPRVIGSMPEEQATNVTSKKMTIYFDEYIKLADPTQNVIVSPPQLEMPEITGAGKKIVIKLQDSLKANTTYTIDFSDAITDNNEGNALGNFTYTFSTGEQIDTFEVAGYVIDAQNLEPVKGIHVGLYDDLADSAFRTKPLLRISRTDSRGHFVIRGVAPGEYRVYALQDGDGDYKFSQKSEMLAFSHATYKPTAGPDIRQDTIWRDSLHIHDVLQVPYTHFYPDDVVLLAFQEQQTDRYLVKQPERINADRITFYFSYGNEQLPVIRGLNFDADSAFILEASEKKDTLTYWLRDTTLIIQDTLSFAMDYLMTDTAGQLVLKTDTLEALAKTPYAKRMKQLQKEIEDWQKEQEKRMKREEPYDTIFPAKPLDIKFDVPSSIDPGRALVIESPTPLAGVDTTAIHLYTQIDSLWYRSSFEFHRRDSMLRQYVVTADWQPGREYSFEVDSAAFRDIYGLVSKSYKQGIQVKSLDEYSTIALQLTGVQDTNVMVQLLNDKDAMVKEQYTDAGGTARFIHVTPGTYYARAFVDLNGNGQWDTGNYDADLQPEDVYYYSREIEAKAKFDIKLKWDMTAKKRHQQKPSKLIKQKDEKSKKKQMNRNEERAKKMGITYEKKQIVTETTKKK